MPVHSQKDRQFTLKSKADLRSHNHFCRRKTISITHFQCVFVALIIQHAQRIAIWYCHPWHICPCHNFPHYIINGTIFGKTILNVNMCFDLLYNFYLKYVLF